MVLEVREALVVHFCNNLIKQKLKSTPDLVWVGQVRSGPGPHPGVCQPVHAQGEGLQLWSLSQLGENLAGVVPSLVHGPRDILGQLPPPPGLTAVGNA